MASKNGKPLRRQTRLCLTGNPAERAGFVNPPIYRGSTTTFPTYAKLIAEDAPYAYGRPTTPTTDGLADAVRTLEGSDGILIAPSGLSALSFTFLALLNAGDHILCTDALYAPTRRFLSQDLSHFGIAVDFFDPCVDGEGLSALITPQTRAVFLESPAWQSMEIHDIPALVAVAKKASLLTIIDNTWATPLFFRAHDFGIDVSIHSASKYFGGHADILLGTISANGDTLNRLRKAYLHYGLSVGSDEAALCLRGLRTLEVRLKAQAEAGLEIARWLEEHKDVVQVLHPALKSHPQHHLWQRDFGGASGLFSLALKPCYADRIDAFFDALQIFSMGYSWGGYESLAVPFVKSKRDFPPPDPGGPSMRLSIGLEDKQDLIDDLDQAFRALNKA